MNRVALLLSGGMDSIALAWMLRPHVSYTVDYGHRAFDGEERAAAEVCRQLGIRHRVLRADVSSLGSGDLTRTPPALVAPTPEWWPFRNQFLVTVAGMAAIQDAADTIVIGTVFTDDRHADGRPQFLEKLDSVLALQEGGLRLQAPAAHMTTPELVRSAQIPEEILYLAHSCHRASLACGRCRGCMKYIVVKEHLAGRMAWPDRCEKR